MVAGAPRRPVGAAAGTRLDHPLATCRRHRHASAADTPVSSASRCARSQRSRVEWSDAVPRTSEVAAAEVPAIPAAAEVTAAAVATPAVAAGVTTIAEVVTSKGIGLVT